MLAKRRWCPLWGVLVLGLQAPTQAQSEATPSARDVLGQAAWHEVNLEFEDALARYTLAAALAEAAADQATQVQAEAGIARHRQRQRPALVELTPAQVEAIRPLTATGTPTDQVLQAVWAAWGVRSGVADRQARARLARALTLLGRGVPAQAPGDAVRLVCQPLHVLRVLLPLTGEEIQTAALDVLPAVNPGQRRELVTPAALELVARNHPGLLRRLADEDSLAIWRPALLRLLRESGPELAGDRGLALSVRDLAAAGHTPALPWLSQHAPELLLGLPLTRTLAEPYAQALTSAMQSQPPRLDPKPAIQQLVQAARNGDETWLRFLGSLPPELLVLDDSGKLGQLLQQLYFRASSDHRRGRPGRSPLLKPELREQVRRLHQAGFDLKVLQQLRWRPLPEELVNLACEGARALARRSQAGSGDRARQCAVLRDLINSLGVRFGNNQLQSPARDLLRAYLGELSAEPGRLDAEALAVALTSVGAVQAGQLLDLLPAQTFEDPRLLAPLLVGGVAQPEREPEVREVLEAVAARTPPSQLAVSLAAALGAVVESRGFQNGKPVLTDAALCGWVSQKLLEIPAAGEALAQSVIEGERARQAMSNAAANTRRGARLQMQIGNRRMFGVGRQSDEDRFERDKRQAVYRLRSRIAWVVRVLPEALSVAALQHLRSLDPGELRDQAAAVFVSGLLRRDEDDEAASEASLAVLAELYQGSAWVRSQFWQRLSASEPPAGSRYANLFRLAFQDSARYVRESALRAYRLHREAYTRSLAPTLKRQRAVAALRARLAADETTPVVLIGVAEALAALRASEALPDLLELLAHDDPAVAAAAESAVEALAALEESR